MLRYTLLRSFLCIGLGLACTNAFAENAPWVGTSLDGAICTGNPTGFGPFDYRQRFTLSHQLQLVEKHHFTAHVQQLGPGKILGDLDYTLRAWPNHYQALQAITRYAHLHKTSKEKAYQRPLRPAAECYFQRAIHFANSDATTYLLYGIYLHKSGHTQKAAEIYDSALTISPDNRSLHYNYGLLLFNMKKYEQAQDHATRAYQAGYPLPGLKKLLMKSGHWKETPKTTEAASSQ